MESDIVSGQQSTWVLLKKLGEGDAGEVYLVESLLDKQAAILKRPVRSAFASDVIRQTAQITTEGKILKALSAALKMDADFTVHVPEVIDQSKPGTAYSDRLFIVIDQARGFDLSLIARTAQLGMMSGTDTLTESPEEKRFLQSIAENGQVPERILLSALNTLLGLFEKIHSRAFDIDGLEVHGILWNDVKPEHLFWDPWRAQFTIIDWGNGQFLGRDGATKDRRYSAIEDYRQLIDEMGRFLEMTAPALHHRLNWPARSLPDRCSPETLQALRERIWEGLQEQLFGLREARELETELLRRGANGLDFRTANPLKDLEDLHRRIAGYGEMPDYAGALALGLSYANRFLEEDRLEEVQHICEWAAGLPGSRPDQLRIAGQLALIAHRADAQGATVQQHICLSDAIQAALRCEWPAALWNLMAALQNGPEPDWWGEMVTAIRRQQYGPEMDNLQPLLIVRRTLLTLQSMAERMEQNGEVDPQSQARLQELVRSLREEVVPNWAAVDPNPPHTNLTYQEIDGILDEIGAFLPDARQKIDRILRQPRADTRQALTAWENGLFSEAAEYLKDILLSDPDRKRVLRAEQALLYAPEWLEKVHNGPKPGEHYLTFVTDIEYEGRELRNQVGPAGWLDLILEGCRQLRRGAWPPDLFGSMPLLVREMPWLRRFERRERLPAVALEGEPEPEPISPPFAPLNGTVRGKLGPKEDLYLTEPLDAWVPEARGSSARVFGGLLRDTQSRAVPVAIKLMRMDKVDYALPLFKEEVLVLDAMRGVPGVTPMLECGFIQIEGEGRLPTEREGNVDTSLTGSLIRISPMIGQEFINQIEARIEEGCVPYIALEKRNPKENLLALCDASMTGGKYQPVAELLQIAIQICEMLHEAHQRNIVYRDHKILHYYWLEPVRGVFSIDWNVARLHPEGLSDYEKQMDLVQFGARGLHHIMTGRTAPGALPLGPTRPDEIEQAAKTYETQWTYDDQRLPEDLRSILERVLAGGYNSAIELRNDLKQSFVNLPDINL